MPTQTNSSIQTPSTEPTPTCIVQPSPPDTLASQSQPQQQRAAKIQTPILDTSAVEDPGKFPIHNTCSMTPQTICSIELDLLTCDNICFVITCIRLDNRVEREVEAIVIDQVSKESDSESAIDLEPSMPRNPTQIAPIESGGPFPIQSHSHTYLSKLSHTNTNT